MKFFHDEEDARPEPIPGLPEALPEGERVLWQGRPKVSALAFDAFRIRIVLAWFAGVTAWRIAAIASAGGPASEIQSVVLTSTIGAAAAVAVIYGLAYAMARATIYTITDRRVVLRYGAAIRKYVNIPFGAIAAASLKRHGGVGSVALKPAAGLKIAYLHLWPHARPFRFNAPEPLLRALPDADAAVATLCAAMKKSAPETVKLAADAPGPAPQAAAPAGRMPAAA